MNIVGKMLSTCVLLLAILMLYFPQHSTAAIPVLTKSQFLLQFPRAQGLVTGECTSPSKPLEIGQTTTITIDGGAESPSHFYTVEFGAQLAPESVLTITVTPLTAGDPDIIASLVNDCPDGSTPDDKKATAYGGDSISFFPGELVDKTKAHITLSCHYATAGNCEFTLATSLDSKFTLTDGIPQHDSVLHGSVRLYKYTPTLTGSVSVAVTQLQSFVDMYVKVLNAGEDEIYPRPSDATTYQHVRRYFSMTPVVVHLEPTQTLLVTVQGAQSWSAAHTANYNIVATQETSTNVLVPGVSVIAETAANSPRFFKVISHSPTCTVSVAVTPVSGNPDLYSSRTEARPSPEEGKHEKKSDKTYGADIVVYTGDTEMSVTEDLYIGVYSTGETTFQIISSVHCPGIITYTHLVDGQPQYDLVASVGTNYYQFPVSSDFNGHVVMTLSVVSGDPDIFIKTSSTDEAPTSHNAQWASVLPGSDLLTIPAAEIDCKDDDDCYLLIAVEAYKDSLYTISAHTQGVHTLLQAGTPKQDTLPVDDSFNYYVIRWEEDMPELLVSLTTIGSGDADLYIDTRPFPHPDNATWRSITYSKDVVRIHEGDEHTCERPCEYYVAVHAFHATTYSLLADFNSPIMLTPGQSSDVELTSRSPKYFVVRTEVNTPTVTFTVQVYSGSATCYYSTEQIPDPAKSDTYQHKIPYTSGSVIYTLTSEMSTCAKSPADHTECYYFMTIDPGYTDGQVNVLATTMSTHTQLLHGVPSRHEVVANAKSLFKYNVNEAGQQLMLVLTPVTGMPVSYMSREHLQPNQTHSSWSTTIDETVVLVDAADVGNYYISVEAGDVASDFTLLAFTYPVEKDSTVLPLFNGEPQDMLVSSGTKRSFRLDLNNTGENPLLDLTFSFSVLYGDVEFYVTDDGNVANNTHSKWSSKFNERNYLRILRPAYAVYHITVYARDDSDTLFTITATTDSAVTQLRNGVSVPGELIANDQNYYKITVDQPHVDVTIAVTTVTGDPDLYVSDTELFPSAEKHTWSSATWRNDSVTISADDARKSGDCQASGVCTYYISVHSFFMPAEYTVTATFNTPIIITAGVAQTQHLEANAWMYYKFFLRSSTVKSLSVSITASRGIPWVYVDVNKRPTDDPAGHKWSLTGYQSVGGVLVIDDTMAGFCHSNTESEANTECVYWIAVRAVVNPADYSIVVNSQNSLTQLRDGIPVNDKMSGDEYKYYYYTIMPNPEDPTAERSGSDVLFIVTPFNGDPDVYGSATIEKPSKEAGHYDQRSISSGVDVLELTNAKVGVYYLAVYAAGGRNCSYSIAATPLSTNNTHPVTLIDGVSQAGIVSNKNWMYFQLEIDPSATRVDVAMFSTAGDPDLYLKFGTIKPNMTHFDKSSTSAAASDVISISDLSQYFTDVDINARVITIGVHGFKSSAFSLSATTNNAIQRVQAGISIYVHETTPASSHYMYTVEDIPSDSNNDFEVSLTVFYGAPELYITTNPEHPRPDANHYEFAAIGFNNNSVTIPASMLKLATYFMSVECVSSCSYSMLPTLNSRALLADGLPQMRSVRDNVARFFTFFPSDRSSDVTITVSPITIGESCTLAVNLGDIDPSITESKYKAIGSSLLSVTIPAADLTDAVCGVPTESTDGQVSCHIRILVIARAESESAYASYSIQAATSVAHLVLQDSVPVRTSSLAQKYRYFTFANTYAKANIAVTVTPVSGSGSLGTIKLYMSTKHSEPNSTHTDWSSDGYSTNPTVNADHTHAAYNADGSFYIAVLASYDAVYTVMLTVTPLDDHSAASILLVPGKPQSGLVLENQKVYYRYYVGNDPRVVLSVNAIYGDPDMFVSNDGQRPTESHWVKKSTSPGSDQIRFDEHDGCKNCWYDIMVFAWSKTLFNIVGQGSSHAVELLSGVPIDDVVDGINADGTVPVRHYTLYVERSDSPVSISMTPLNGNPDLYVSTTVQSPNAQTCACEGCCLRSSSEGAETITVPTPTIGTYYIGVQSANTQSSDYSLVGYTGVLQLLPGIPQSGEVRQDATVLYQYTVKDSAETKSDVRFSLTQNAASDAAVMYINAVSTTTQGIVDPPSSTHHMWNSSTPDASQQEFRGEVYISIDDPHYCFDCVYLVALVGPHTVINTAYTVTVSSSSDVITLVAGVPAKGVVKNNNTQEASDRPFVNYYRTYLNTAKTDVSVNIATMFGATYTYISRNSSHPNATTAEWQGNNVVIPQADAGLYFIAVHGVATDLALSTYTITVSADNTLLYFGDPQQVTIKPDGSFLFFKLEDSTADISLQFTPVQSVESESVVNSVDIMNVLTVDSAISTHRHLLFGSASTTTHSSVMHSLKTTTRSQAHIASLAERFSLDMPSSLAATLTYDVYISTNSSYRHPDANTPVDQRWHYTVSPGKYQVILMKSDPRFCVGCTYFVGITGEVNEKVMVLATTPNTVASLVDRVVVSDTVNPANYRYYSVNVGQVTTRNMTILTEACYGRVNVYVSYDSYQPNQHTANYRVENQPGLARIDLSTDKASQAVFNAYTVGVYGAEAPPIGAFNNVLYSIQALSDYKEPLLRTPEPLSASTPAMKTVSLQVPRVWFAQEVDSDVTLVKYHVYYALTSSKPNMHTQCGMKLLGTPVGPYFMTASATTITVSVDGLADATTYTFNVVAQHPTNGAVGVNMPVTITTLSEAPVPSGDGGDDNNMKWLLLLIIPVAVLGIAAIVYLVVKNRKLTQELAVEMHDVPKSSVAKAVRGPPSTQPPKQKNYSQLLDDDGLDDSDSTNYNPPQTKNNDE